MSYINSYKPPIVQPLVLPDIDGPWDMKFCLPIPAELNSERVKLVPFLPRDHFSQLLEGVKDHPELYNYLPYGPLDTLEKIAYWHEHRIRSDPATLLFAIIDKTSPSPDSHPEQGGALAGVLGYLMTYPDILSTEIGHVLVFPKWHKTFLATNAIALLLIHALDGSIKDGWGLRRVQWQAMDKNAPSIRAAQRLGLKMEGIIRWQRLIPIGPTEFGVYVGDRPGDPMPNIPSRHSAMLAMCWDHYSREELETLMARTK